MNAVVEIEADAGQGRAVFFPPLQRAVRGRLVIGQCPEADGGLMRTWSAPVPGMVIGLTADGVGFLRDPLAPEAARSVVVEVAGVQGGPRPVIVQDESANRTRVEKAGLRLGPAREEFPGADVPTWMWWMKRCVEAGLARVISGQLPETISGNPKRSFVTPERPDPQQTLAGVIEGNNKLLAALLSHLTGSETAKPGGRSKG